MDIPFIDLDAQEKVIGKKLEGAVETVLQHKKFINGPEVSVFEESLAKFANVNNAITCGSGTDALLLPLMAIGIGEGDAVFVPSFTFVATAEVVSLLKATPFFVDVDIQTFNIDPEKLRNAIIASKKMGLKPKVIIPVDLFGQPACYDQINEIAEEFSLNVISDAAQSFGAKHNGSFSCSMTDLATTSFFPAKPLGCYGDGGAIFSKDESLLEKTRIISRHGQKKRYEYVDVGMNSRLDTIQASILIEKMKIYENEIALRNDVAHKYNSRLDHLDVIKTPEIPESTNRSVWAQYTILLDNELKHKRDKIMNLLKEDGVPSALYYPAPLHLQPPFRNGQRLPITEEISKRVLSLPMHPYLEDNEIDFIAQKLKINLNKQ